MTISHRFIETNGIRMHLAEAGSGPTVLLCHGFPECWYSWRHQLEALAAAGYRAIAPDWIGALRLRRGAPADPAAPPPSRHVLLCGFGRVGSAIGEALETFGIPFEVVERDPDVIQELRRRRVQASELGSALAYGEQRLLEVAIALAAEPKLLLLDEPVSGMNPAEKADFMKMLGAIRARGITILLVEHDMRTVMDISDRVVVLNQGRIIADDVPSEIQRNPEVIRAYLGEGYRRAHG